MTSDPSTETTKSSQDESSSTAEVRWPWPQVPSTGAPAARAAATDVALRLLERVRDDLPGAVALASGYATRWELEALIEVLAAMVPPAPVPEVLLEWTNAPPHLWTRWTLDRELERASDGHRDRTALAAYAEASRRRNLLTERADRHLATQPGAAPRRPRPDDGNPNDIAGGAWRSGLCQIETHARCAGAYPNAQCTCPCHDDERA